MIKNNVYYEFFASYTVPNSDEVGYWVDLGANSKGKVIKIYNSDIKEWVKVTDATSEDAVSPFIGSNGNWWVDNRDTGIPAAGKNPYIGENGNWWVYDALANDYIDTGVIAKGTSAYDIAVSNGFQGTEQEWLESLKEPAKKAAEEALKAAEEANEAADRVDEGLTSVNEAIEDANTAIDNAEQATANAQEVAVNTPKIVDTYWYIYDLNTHSYVNTFVEAVGKSFKIVKSYPSEDALMADFDNPEVDYGEFVWIRTGNVEDPEDSRLYLKTEEGWDLVGDLSGMQGIEGQSAYEIAVEHGYVGSENDWLQSIKQPALDAADEALAAKDEIIAAQDSIEAAEEARVEAEKDREEAEGVRASNEATRQQQEADREKDTADAINAVNEAKNATEAAIKEAQTQADRAKDYADNPPKIENDKWYLWSEVTDSYLDTGVKATGIHGKSPYIEGGTWWVYNDETDEYWDTSISVNSDYVLTKAKVEGVLTGDITSHNHDSRYIKDAPADGKQYARKNSNWSEVVIPEVDLSNYLAKDNTVEFTPDADYEPATKKYVDDNVSIVNKDLQSYKEQVSSNLNLKVDKVNGKQLSTNDYTNEEKSKLAGIAAGAEVNVNADWNATEGDAQILNKPIIITGAEVDQKINNAIASVYRVKGSVANYESLPTTDVIVGDVWNLEDTGANYVATSTTPTWDKLSETVDLSAYSTTAQNDEKYQPKGNYSTSFADEEDITSVSNKLKLKDRAYDEANFSGLGYKILRKNIQNGKNILTQDMINETNTIYEIRYDFDLNSTTITIPEGCVLKFESGSLRNGIISNSNIRIIAERLHILKNVSIQDGNILGISFPEWFGAIADESIDSYNALQNCFNASKSVLLGNGTYLSNSTLLMSEKLELFGLGKSSCIKCNGIKIKHINSIKNLSISPIDENTECLIDINSDTVTSNFLRSDIENIYAKGTSNKSNITSIFRIKSDVNYNIKGFHSLNIRNIYSDGFFNNGILFEGISTESTKSWATNITIRDCFFYAVKAAIKFSSTNEIANNWQDIKFLNVESQYKEGYTENFAILRDIKDSIFDGCHCWDSINKIYQYYLSNDNVTIAIKNNPVGYYNDKFIYSAVRQSSGLKVFYDHVADYSDIYNSGYYIIKSRSIAKNYEMDESAPDTVKARLTYIVERPTDSSIPDSFRGFSITNSIGYSSKRQDAYLGADKQGRPCCAVRNSGDTGDIDFKFIYSDMYMPHSSTESRPSKGAIGGINFDTTLNRPVWWNGTKWIDPITDYDAPSDGKLYGRKDGTWEFIDLSTLPSASNILTKDNTTEYTPTSDYNPSTKKYVDDAINSIVGEIIINIPSGESGNLTAGSFANIKEAFDNGITILAKIENDGLYGVAKVTATETVLTIWLSSVIADGSTKTYKYTINSDESYTRELLEIDSPSIDNITGIDSDWLTLLQETPTDYITRWPTWNEVTEKPTFANVATSGSYNDLTDAPDLATVAISGSYSDLVNTPEIVSPENVLQINNTTEYIPTGDYNPATKKYIDDSVSTINSSVTTLVSFMNFYEGANTVTSLTSLPVDKRSVVANLDSASDLTLSNAIPVGREIYIRIYNTSSVGFDQPIPSTGAFHSMNGSSVTVPGYSWIEMSIWCYAEGNYSIRIGEIN